MPFSMTRAFHSMCCGQADQDEQHMDNNSTNSSSSSSSSSNDSKEHHKKRKNNNRPSKDSETLYMGRLPGNSSLDSDEISAVPRPGPFPIRTDLQVQQHKKLSRGLHAEGPRTALPSSQNTTAPGPPRIELSLPQEGLSFHTTGSPETSASTTGSDIGVTTPPATSSEHLLLQETTTASTPAHTGDLTENSTSTSTPAARIPTILITPPTTPESPLAQQQRRRHLSQPPNELTSPHDTPLLPQTPPSSPSLTRPRLIPSRAYLTLPLPTTYQGRTQQIHRPRATQAGQEPRQLLAANVYPPGTYRYSPWPTDSTSTATTSPSSTSAAASPRDRYLAVESTAPSSQDEDEDEDLTRTARPESRLGFRNDDGDDDDDDDSDDDDAESITMSSSSSVGPSTQPRRSSMNAHSNRKTNRPSSLRSLIAVQRQLGESQMEPIAEVQDGEDEEEAPQEGEGGETEQGIVLKATVCTMKRYTPRQVRQIRVPTSRRTAKPPMQILEPISEVE